MVVHRREGRGIAELYLLIIKKLTMTKINLSSIARSCRELWGFEELFQIRIRTFGRGARTERRVLMLNLLWRQVTICSRTIQFIVPKFNNVRLLRPWINCGGVVGGCGQPRPRRIKLIFNNYLWGSAVSSILGIYFHYARKACFCYQFLEACWRVKRLLSFLLSTQAFVICERGNI